MKAKMTVVPVRLLLCVLKLDNVKFNSTACFIEHKIKTFSFHFQSTLNIIVWFIHT